MILSLDLREYPTGWEYSLVASAGWARGLLIDTRGVFECREDAARAAGVARATYLRELSAATKRRPLIEWWNATHGIREMGRA